MSKRKTHLNVCHLNVKIKKLLNQLRNFHRYEKESHQIVVIVFFLSRFYTATNTENPFDSSFWVEASLIVRINKTNEVIRSETKQRVVKGIQANITLQHVWSTWHNFKSFVAKIHPSDRLSLKENKATQFQTHHSSISSLCCVSFVICFGSGIFVLFYLLSISQTPFPGKRFSLFLSMQFDSSSSWKAEISNWWSNLCVGIFGLWWKRLIRMHYCIITQQLPLISIHTICAIKTSFITDSRRVTQREICGLLINVHQQLQSSIVIVEKKSGLERFQRCLRKKSFRLKTIWQPFH